MTQPTASSAQSAALEPLRRWLRLLALGVLIRRCKWCDWWFGLKPGGWGFTDGMCRGCSDRMAWELDGIPAPARGWWRGAVESLAVVAAMVLLGLAAQAVMR